MKPPAPEDFDGDATTDRLDPTWKTQVDLSRLDRPDSQVYFLSVTRVDQSKTVQARITKSSLSAARKTLVLGTVKLFHKFEGGHPEWFAWCCLRVIDTVLHNGACVFSCMWHNSQNSLVQCFNTVDID